MTGKRRRRRRVPAADEMVEQLPLLPADLVRAYQSHQRRRAPIRDHGHSAAIAEAVEEHLSSGHAGSGGDA